MALWFANRGSGVVLVALLTLATALGVLSTARLGSRLWPRFLTQGLHRNVSLLAVALLVVHAATAVADEFVDLRWYHVLVPVGGEYVVKERLPLVMSSLATWFLAVVVATSLMRARLPARTWRAIHLLTYVSWLLGLVHGLLIGTDTRTWWDMGVTVASAVVVAAAVVARLITLRAEQVRATGAEAAS